MVETDVKTCAEAPPTSPIGTRSDEAQMSDRIPGRILAVLCAVEAGWLAALGYGIHWVAS